MALDDLGNAYYGYYGSYTARLMFLSLCDIHRFVKEIVKLLREKGVNETRFTLVSFSLLQSHVRESY